METEPALFEGPDVDRRLFVRLSTGFEDWPSIIETCEETGLELLCRTPGETVEVCSEELDVADCEILVTEAIEASDFELLRMLDRPWDKADDPIIAEEKRFEDVTVFEGSGTRKLDCVWVEARELVTIEEAVD